MQEKVAPEPRGCADESRESPSRNAPPAAPDVTPARVWREGQAVAWHWGGGGSACPAAFGDFL